MKKKKKKKGQKLYALKNNANRGFKEMKCKFIRINKRDLFRNSSVSVQRTPKSLRVENFNKKRKHKREEDYAMNILVRNGFQYKFISVLFFWFFYHICSDFERTFFIACVQNSKIFFDGISSAYLNYFSSIHSFFSGSFYFYQLKKQQQQQ